MDTETKQTKTDLLQEIEALIAYGKTESTISPDLLQYLSLDDLLSIKKNLEKKVGTLSEADKQWLEQFKKYE